MLAWKSPWYAPRNSGGAAAAVTDGPMPDMTISPIDQTVMARANPAMSCMTLLSPNPAPTSTAAEASTRWCGKRRSSREKTGCKKTMSTPLSAMRVPYAPGERPWLRRSMGSVTKDWKSSIQTSSDKPQKATNRPFASGVHGGGRRSESTGAGRVSGTFHQTMPA